jgi:UDP-N-acetylglucosamine 2-epimerase
MKKFKVVSVVGTRPEQALWQVDASKAHTLLGWTPPVTMQAQLRKMVQAG